ncbi:MAG: hypothetical protein GWN30_25635, partial [Gammaproteobacteria bacterium]|nr:hypothetical protein [Gammaproteobacteria bacterium]
MIERISKNRKRIIITAKDYSLLTIGAIFMAINFNVFMSPTQIAPGGIGGIVLILTRYLRLSEGTLFLILQAIMIAIGFRHLGRFQFLVRVIYVSVLYSLGVDFLKPWLPAAGITNDLLLNSVYGGIVGGIGSGLIFLGRSSGAGTNVISRAIQMRTGIPISQLYIYIDGAIIVLLGFFFGWDRALYGMMML